MASKAQIFLLVNLLFFVLVNGQSCNTGGGNGAPGGNGGSNGGGNGGNGGSGGNGGGGNGGDGGNGGGGMLTCPINPLGLGPCGSILGIGNAPTLPCCSLLAGLVDLQAAVCLCAAIRANVIGINISIRLTLTLILNTCGRNLPIGFVC